MKKQDKPINIAIGDAKQVVPAIESLLQSAGWQIISEVLTKNIIDIENTILDSDETWTAEELTKWRDMRFFEKQLLQLPNNIIKAYKTENKNTVNIELDPYKLDN